MALRADTGAVVGPVNSQLGQTLRMLHVFLFFGPRWIVGFLGVAMLVLIATGIVIHRKILAELFTQRWGRSLRVVTSDLHKSAGIWGLGFHILIAGTGAWLGLAPLFEQGWRYIATGPAPASRGHGAGTGTRPRGPGSSSSHAVAGRTACRRPAGAAGLRGHHAVAAAMGHTGGAGPLHRQPAGASGQHRARGFRGAGGRIRQVHDPRTAGFWSMVNALMEPLHFDDFGGLPLKCLYFLLGLTPAFLSITGTLIWLDGRRQRMPAPPHA